MIIMVAKTGRLMQTAARLRMTYSATVTDEPSARPPGVDDDHVAGRRRRRGSRRDRRRAGRCGRACSVSLAVLDHQNLLDAGEHDQRRLRHDQRRRFEAVTMSALAKVPGRRRAVRRLGTSASIGSVRVPSSDRRADARDAAFVHVLLAFDGDAHALADAARRRRRARARASCRRSGCWRTTVTIGVPAARYSPANTRRSRITPSIGERSMVSSSCCRASASSERRCGEHRLPVAHFFERVLLAGLRRSPRRRRRLRGRPSPRCRAATKVAMRSRWRRASVSAGARLPDERGLDRHRPCRLSPVGSRPRRARACCRAASDCRKRQFEIGRREPGDDIALATRSSPDRRSSCSTPAGDLEAERDLFFGGERAAHRDAARQSAAALQPDDLDGLGRRRLGLTRGRRRGVAARDDQ